MIEEMLSIARRFKARREFADTGFKLDALANRCPKCNYMYRKEGNAIFVCGHQLTAIKREADKENSTVADPPSQFNPFPSLGGLALVHDIEGQQASFQATQQAASEATK